MRLTECCGVAGMNGKHLTGTSEEGCEICDLKLLGLSVTGPCRVAEIDAKGGKIWSWVDSRIGDQSRTLIGSSHLVMKTGEMMEFGSWGLQDTYVFILIAVLMRSIRDQGYGIQRDVRVRR
jgi:hypothetical protein